MITTYLTFFIVSLLLTSAATPMVRWIAIHFKILDVPDDRKVHKELIPRLGGIAIYLGIVMTLFIGYFVSEVARDLIDKNFRLCVLLLIGSSILCMTGAVDDSVGLSAWKKLLFQVIAAFIAYFGGLHLHIYESISTYSPLFSIVTMVLTVFWVTVITNSINLIDGLDGLASGITIIVVLVLSVISHHNGNIVASFFAIVVAGSVLGFIRYNIYPAKMFLGDSGSLLLGYLLANLTLNGIQQKSLLSSLTIAILLLSMPLLDTTLAVFRRFMKGHSIFFADGNHIHHRFLKRGIKHPMSIMILWTVTLIFGMAALLISLHDVGPVREFVNIFSVLLLGFLSVRFSSSEIFEFIKFFRSANRRKLTPRSKNITVRRAISFISSFRELQKVRYYLIELAEKIDLDYMLVEIIVDRMGRSTMNEFLHWERQLHQETEAYGCASGISITSSIYKGRDGIICKVNLGKKKWKLRRQSEEDQVWAKMLSKSIAEVYLKLRPETR